MNIHDLDLNLLLVFDAIYRERSISAAADKLDLSQPAVSNALRRLREYMGDTLFFRAGNEMKPTRMGNSLAVPIGHALAMVQHSLNAARTFDPRTSNRTFRIAINDMFRLMLLPTLLGLVEREAPGIRLELLPQPSTPAELLSALKAEDLDLGLMPLRAVDDSVSSTVIANDELLNVVRKDHPALSGPITRDTIRKLRWIVFSSTPALHAVANKIFQDAGIQRQIAVVMPDLTSVPAAIEVSDLVAMMSRSFFERSMRDFALASLPLPIRMPTVQTALIWSKSADDDQGLLWLRKHVEEILRTALSFER